MSKFHINPESGNPGLCNAKIQCRFGSPSEHFDSPEEARSHYEKQMGLAVFKKPLTDAEKRQNAIDSFNSREFRLVNIVEADKRIIGRVLQGEESSPEEIDSMLERNWTHERSGPEHDEKRTAVVNQIFDEVRKERTQMGIGSTLPTLATFDPEVQSVFSSNIGRDEPFVGISGIEQSFVRAKAKMRAAEYYDKYPDLNVTDDNEKKKYKSAAQTARMEAERAESRAVGLAQEVAWLSQNNTQYARKMTVNDRAVLKNALDTVKHNGIPIADKVRQLKHGNEYKLAAPTVARELIESREISIMGAKSNGMGRNKDGSSFQRWTVSMRNSKGQMIDTSIKMYGSDSDSIYAPDHRTVFTRAITNARAADYYQNVEQFAYELGLNMKSLNEKTEAETEYQEMKSAARQFRSAVGETMYSRIIK